MPRSTFLSRRKRLKLALRPLSLESLEQRIAPAYTSTLALLGGVPTVTFTDSSGANDTLTIDAVMNGGQLLLEHGGDTDAAFADAFDFNSAVAGSQHVLASAAFNVIVQAGDGDDIVNIGTPAHAATLLAAGGFTIQSGTGTDSIVVDDSAGATARTITLDAASLSFSGGPAVAYSNFESLTVYAGTGNDTFACGSTNVHLDGGSGADSYLITLAGGTASANIEISDSGTNTSQTDSVVVNGSALNDSITIHNASVTSGGESVSLDKVETLAVNGNNGNDVLNVTENVLPLTVTGGAGNDTVNVSSDSPDNVGNLNGIEASINIDGGAGTNLLNISDYSSTSTLLNPTPNSNITITPAAVTGIAGPTDNIAINYLNFSGLSVTGSNQVADTFNISNTAIPTTIDGAGGDDVFNLGNAGTLDNIGATLTLIGGRNVAGDALNINDSADTTSNTYVVNASVIDRNALSINFVGFENLKLLSGTGDDHIDLSNSPLAATVTGGLGSDTIIGTNYSDSILAGAGDDCLSGGLGNDSILGEAGSNTITGGEGNDYLIGTSGSVALLIAEGDTNFTLSNTRLTGLGNDTISGFSQAIINGGGSDNLIDASAFSGSVSLTGFGGNDTLIGGSGADSIVGGFGNESLVGNAGADTIASDSGSDTLDGGTGNDRLLHSFVGSGNSVTELVDAASLASDTDTVSLTGTSGADTFNVTASSISRGNEIVNYGNIEQISLDAGDGNDVFNVSSTALGIATTLAAGAGNDTVNVSSDGAVGLGTADNILGSLSINGGADSNALMLSSFASTAKSVTLSTAGSVLSIAGLAGQNGTTQVDYQHAGSTAILIHGSDIGSDTFNVRGTLSNTTTTINGHGGVDTFNVGDSSNTLDRILGAVNLNGNAAFASEVLTINDQGSVSGHNYVVSGSSIQRNAAAAISFGTLETVIINTGSGDDTIDAGSSSLGLTINSGSGNDAVTGSAYDDSIVGGLGNDTLDGKAGNDTFVGGLGNDAIDGGTGTDLLVETLDSGSVNFTLTDAALTGNGTDALANVEQVQLTGNNSANTINASAFSGTVTLSGGNGNDVLIGGSGSDSLVGDAGNDSLVGGDGSDSLIGDAGDDSLNGGLGGDTYIESGLGGADTINDNGATGVDALIVNGTASNDILTLSAVSATTGSVAFGSETVTYSNVEGLTVNADAGADEIDVRGAIAGTPVVINAGDGNDVVNVSSAAPGAGNLDGILANLTVHGQGGSDVLNLDDSASATGHIYSIIGDTVTRSGGTSPVGYDGVETLNLKAGSGNDSFDPVHASTTASINIDGGAGADSLSFADDGLYQTRLTGQILVAGRQPVTYTNLDYISPDNTPQTPPTLGSATAIPLQFASFADIASAKTVAGLPTLRINSVGAGQTGFFDADGNGIQNTDGSEPTLIRVTSGRALVFLTDEGHFGSFDASEITGLALADGTSAEVFYGVNGSVVTDVAADGTLTDATTGSNDGHVLAAASIAGLNIHGNVAGVIAAGGSISNITIGGTIGNLSYAGSIRTGDQATIDATSGVPTIDFGAGSNTFTLASFSNGFGVAGGDVSNVIASGLIGLGGGDIFTATGGAGARGGNISNIALSDQIGAFSIVAGAGGGGISVAKGGVGGSINGISISHAELGLGTGVLTAGDGGVPAAASALLVGGAGGSISNVSIVNANGNYMLTAGAGIGDGWSSNAFTTGGAGGSMQNITVHTVNGNIALFGGFGGTAANDVVQKGVGGAGGSLNTLDLLATGSGNSIFVLAGDGGSGSLTGGTGGSVTGNLVHKLSTTNIEANGLVTIFAGNGGFAIGDSVAAHGGIGGSILNANFASDSSIVSLTTGAGGSAQTGANAGGITNVDILQSFGATVRTGQGGVSILSTGSATANGGNGGSIFDLGILNDGNSELGTVNIVTGDGGFGTKTAGAGGSISGLHGLTTESFAVQTGAGGAGINIGNAAITAKGGNGGSVDGFSIAANGAVLLTTGAGGAGEFNGGAGGSIGTGSVTAFSSISLTTGFGGDVTSETAKGVAGNGGSVSAVSLDSSLAAVTVITGAGGNGNAVAGGAAGGGTGGSGGNVTALAVNRATTVTVATGNGGAGTFDNGLVTVKGGTGGSINGFTVVNATGVISAEAGDGGSGTSVAGVGGSISNINLYTNASVEGAITLTAGNGGAAANLNDDAKGGAGGGMASINARAGAGSIVMTAGAGGMGDFSGGNGGSIVGGTLFGSLGVRVNNDGAAAGGSVNLLSNGVGGIAGNGGSVSRLAIDTNNNEVSIFGGFGGTGPATTGGNGGSLDSIAVDRAGSVVFFAGFGGAGTVDLVGRGGNGGSISNSSILRGSAYAVAIAGGGGAGTSVGGNGGSLIANNFSTVGSMMLQTGSAGAGSNLDMTAVGGDAGSIIKSTFRTSDSSATIQAITGSGGSGDTKGGAGGSVSGSMFQASGQFVLVTGNGGNNSVLAARNTAGAAGSVTDTIVDTDPGFVTVVTGTGGSGANGGTGGSINNLHITDAAAVTVTLGNGGFGSYDAARLAGKGGAGGSINGLMLDSSLGEVNIAAGDGGSGAGAGGAGGSVNGAALLTNGAIVVEAGMGGAGASARYIGVGGTGGSITNGSWQSLNSTITAVAGAGGGGQVTGGHGGSFNGMNLIGPAGVSLLGGQGGFSNGDLNNVSILSQSRPLYQMDGRASTYGMAQDFATGLSPVAIASTDFNGDGINDLIVANTGSNSITVLFGNSRGGFGTSATGSAETNTTDGVDNDGDGVIDDGGRRDFDLTSGTQPKAMEVTDLNGDGNADILVANKNGTLNILLGDGTGGISPSSPAAITGLGTDLTAVKTADIDGDGDLDILVTDAGANMLRVLEGDGGSTFTLVRSVGVGVNPIGIATADVNRDGFLDVLIANRGDVAISNSSNVSVILGNGSLVSMQNPSQSVPVGNNPTSLVVTDVNGDGLVDIVTASGTDNTVSVVLGNQRGTFGNIATGKAETNVTNGVDDDGDGSIDDGGRLDFAVGTNPTSVTVQDVNGDGHMDILTTDAGSETVSILYGNGASGPVSFQPRQFFLSGGSPVGLVVMNVQDARDGGQSGPLSDFVTVNRVGSHGVGGHGGDVLNTTIDTNSTAVTVSAGDGALGGGAGGDIGKLTVLHGSDVSLSAGDGGDSFRDGGGKFVTAGGMGGGVLDSVIVTTTGDLTVSSGDGGNGTGGGGRGGDMLRDSFTASGDLMLNAGNGGHGNNMSHTSSGGRGGNIDKVIASSDGSIDINNGLALFGDTTHIARGGAGATDDGGADKNGGDGGSITNSTFNAATRLTLLSGVGGDASMISGANGKGGAGGSIGKTTVSAPLGSIEVFAGAGGGGPVGNHGGDVTGLIVTGADELAVLTGDGGNSALHQTDRRGQPLLATGGRGGNMSGLVVSNVSGGVQLSVGTGGIGTAAGGDGGSLSDSAIQALGSLTANAGTGGTGFNVGALNGDGSENTSFKAAKGGNGGSISGLTLNIGGDINLNSAGIVNEFNVAGSDSNPNDVVFGPDGAFWFTESGSNQIGRLTRTGVLTEYTLPNAGSNPTAITVGPDGALWFTETSGNRIGRITTAGEITEYQLAGGSTPTSIVAVGNDTLWFTEQGAARIGSITTSGTISEVSITAGSNPTSIVLGTDGALWFTEAGNGGKIGRMDTNGILTAEYTATGTPQSITLGPDGVPWFTLAGSSQIGRIAANGTIDRFDVAGGAPTDIVAGPDRSLWFTQSNSNLIGRITVSGVLSEFAVPGAGSAPTSITAGPDGALWFTEAAANQIGRITFGAYGGTGQASGGLGGSISKITIDSLGGIADLRAGNGGMADNPISGAALGGDGGNVTKINVNAIGATGLLRDIVAGDGGAGHNAAATGVAGDGGSIGMGKGAGINVTGWIGDPTEVYGIAAQGGLFAGAGGVGDLGLGLAGSITQVKADGITSLAAGIAPIPGYATLIDKIAATVIGADVNGDGKFGFVDAGTHNALYDVGEVPIDGIVMALEFGHTGVQTLTKQPVSPLFELIGGIRTGTQLPS